MDPGWFAVIGAAIGGLAGVTGPLLTTLIQQRREDWRALRPELRNMVVSFTAAAQDAWNANRKLAMLRYTLRTSPNKESALRALEEECKVADDRVSKELANLRLTHPELGQLGAQLSIVWGLLGVEHILNPESEIDMDYYRKSYQESLDAFEVRAREMLRIH